MGDYTAFKVGGGIVLVVAAIIAIVLSISFSNIEYYEMGFKRTKSSGSVDTSKVYFSGRHMIGPDAEFKNFPSDAHFELLSGIEVFNKAKLAMHLTVAFQYFIRSEDLKLLHDKYNINYRTVIRNSAVDSLKAAAPEFTAEQFVGERLAVEDKLYRGIRDRLGGTCCAKNCKSFKLACPDQCIPYNKCSSSSSSLTNEMKGLFVDVKYFQYLSVSIPSEIEERFLKKLTLGIHTEREKYFSDAIIVRKETDLEVRQVKNAAREKSQTATAESNNIKVIAQSKYTAIVEEARATGLMKLYNSLGLTDQKMKSSFDYLRTLRGLDNIHLTVDFQQRIVGGFK